MLRWLKRRKERRETLAEAEALLWIAQSAARKLEVSLVRREIEPRVELEDLANAKCRIRAVLKRGLR